MALFGKRKDEAQAEGPSPPSSLKPDLSKMRLVDPASYEQRHRDAAQAAEARPDPHPMPAGDKDETIGLEFEIDEAKGRHDADRLWGHVTVKESGQRYDWSMTLQNRTVAGCIEGTNVSALHVYESRSDDSLVHFEQGAWQQPAQSEIALTIRDKVIDLYNNEVMARSKQANNESSQKTMGAWETMGAIYDTMKDANPHFSAEDLKDARHVLMASCAALDAGETQFDAVKDQLCQVQGDYNAALRSGIADAIMDADIPEDVRNLVYGSFRMGEAFLVDLQAQNQSRRETGDPTPTSVHKQGQATWSAEERAAQVAERMALIDAEEQANNRDHTRSSGRTY